MDQKLTNMVIVMTGPSLHFSRHNKFNLQAVLKLMQLSKQKKLLILPKTDYIYSMSLVTVEVFKTDNSQTSSHKVFKDTVTLDKNS